MNHLVGALHGQRDHSSRVEASSDQPEACQEYMLATDTLFRRQGFDNAAVGDLAARIRNRHVNS